MEKTIEELEQELQELKESNKALWLIYGSELCAGEMIAKEDVLKKKIESLKPTIFTHHSKNKNDISRIKWDESIKILKEKGLINEKNKQIPAIPKQFLRLKDDLFPSIKDGKKRITIRRGYRDIRIEKLLFEGIKDETLQYEVEVIEVRHILISKVSDEIAREDGFENWVNFYRMMKKYYPDLDVSEECTLIYFE